MKLWSTPTGRRWILWGLLAVTFLLVNIYRLSTAVIAEPLMAAFGTTGAQLGTLHATFFFVYAVMQIPSGILVDRIGPRLTATAGAITMHVGAIWFVLADGYFSALGARLFIGLGGSVIFLCMLRFSASWYRIEEFGTMNGLSFAVGGVGGILATTPFALLVEALDWRSALLFLASLGMVVAIATVVFVRDSPERAGLPPIEGVPEQPRVTLGRAADALSVVLRDRMTWIVSLLLFCTGGVNLTLLGLWGIPYVVQMYDTTVTMASMYTLLTGVGMVVGPPVFGRISDRTGRRNGYIIAGTVVYIAVLLPPALVGTPPLVFVAALFFLSGFLFGAFVLTYPIIKERHTSRVSGISLGAINGASFFGASLLPYLMGFALDAYWTGELFNGVRVYTVTGYRMAFALACLAGVISLFCALWIHWETTHADT